MTANGWLQIGFFLFVIFALTKPLGVFMARVFNREKTFLDFAGSFSGNAVAPPRSFAVRLETSF